MTDAAGTDSPEMAMLPAEPLPYPGGKGACFRHIINHMPPHRVYIEPFLGGGNVMLRKRPAESGNIGIDLSRSLIAGFSDAGRAGNFQFIHGDGIQYLREYAFQGDELVYCDPPYMHETRKDLSLYEHEMSDAQHADLLTLLLALPCYVMVSGYRCSLYMTMLHTWHYTEFQSTTRHGMATESLWMNFQPNGTLHDYRYTGSSFRERERITRKKRRWSARLAKLPPAERNAVREALDALAQSELPVRISPRQK